MAIEKSALIPGSEITPESVFLDRRRLLGASLALPGLLFVNSAARATPAATDPLTPEDDGLTPEEIVTS
jgi:hypothetical protein